MKVRHALLAAPLATAAPGADVAAETPAPCEASVSLDPSRAVPGQQVAYRLHLLVRSDVSEVAWELPPAFPGLRAERLAAEPFSRQVERGGAIYQIREEARALFAERPGRVTLPSARLACRTRGDLSASIATPEAVLEVIPFPEAELPPGFEGLVGPLSLRPSVTPRSVTLGQSVRVAVTLQGDGNLWDAPAPELSSEALGGAEVFPRPSELVLDRGSRLVVRRRFAIDVVPRREGVLRIPSLAWSYFDPASGRHAEAVAEPVMVVVGPRASARSESDAAAPEPAAPAPEPAVPSERRSFPSWVAGGLLLLAGVGATGWRLLRRRLGVARAVAEAVARAESARAAGDRDGELSALACALRAAVRSELGAALEGRPEEMPASGLSPRARAAVELLLQIEQARFDPKATPPDRAAVRRALARR